MDDAAMQPQETVATRVRYLRGHRRQGECEAATGIPASQWSRLETGASDLDSSKIDRICRVFGVTADWLVRGVGPQPTVPMHIPVPVAKDGAK